MVAKRLIPQIARRMGARTTNTPVMHQTSAALLNRYAPSTISNTNRRYFSAQAAQMHAQSGNETDQSSNSSSKATPERTEAKREDRAPEKGTEKDAAKEKTENKVEKEPEVKAEKAEAAAADAKESSEPEPPQTPEEEALAEGIRAQIAEASDKVKMLQERLLETHKDAEIMRARHKREMDNSHKYGVQKFAKELLEVADNLQRAQEAVAADALKAGGSLKALHDGVGMTVNTLQKVFKSYEIAEFNPEGKVFDPSFHEAMFEAPVPGKEPGTVIHVMNRGYTIHDRVLRAARVGVAK